MLYIYLLLPWTMLFQGLLDEKKFINIFGTSLSIENVHIFIMFIVFQGYNLSAIGRSKFLPLLCYLLSIIISSILGALYKPEYSSQIFSTLSQTMLIFSIIPKMSNDLKKINSRELIEKWIITFIKINVLIVIFVYFYPGELPDGYKYGEGASARAFGMMGDQVGWILPLGIFYLFQKKKFGFAILSLVALIMTGSIGGSFLLLSMFFMNIFLRHSEPLKVFLKSFFVLTLIFVVITIVMQFYPLPAISRLVSGDLFMPGGAGYHRLTTFTFAFEQISKFPFLGSGMALYAAENYDRFYGYSFMGDGLESFEMYTSANNQILQTLLESGALGLSMFIIFNLQILIRAKKLLTFLGQPFAVSMIIWTFCMSLFNQSAIYVIPGSFLFIFLILGWSICLIDLS